MQRKSLEFGLLIVSLCSLATSSCGDSERSKTLSRQVALNLLNKNSAELLRGDQNKVRLIDSNFYHIGGAKANEGEVAGRVPVEFPSLDQLEKDGIGPQDYRYKFFVLGHFLMRLTKRGDFIKQARVNNDQGGMWIEFTEIPHADVEWKYISRNRWGWEPDDYSVLVTIAKPSFSEVTGIQQNGTDAVVDADITYVPTEAYQRIKDAAAETMKDLGRSPEMLGVLCGDQCPFLKISRKNSRQYRFSLYDDGWRVLH